MLVACALVAVLINRRLLHADVFEGDAFVHQYWMWHWRDPQLFNDQLTHDLRESSRYPLGYQALFWVGTQLASPIVFGEWTGVALMAGSGWLVYRIARDHSAWRPAAWLAAALFLALYDIHRFSGGFSRAFVQPVVLLTVLLALRRRPLLAALVAGGGALFYPPAAVLAVGVLLVGALGWRDGRPLIDRRRALFAAVSVGVALLCVLGPQVVDGASPQVLTAAQARRYPEFGASGTLHFFTSSTLEYLRQNRSGFDLRVSGSVVVIAGLALLLGRPANLRLLRGPVLAMPIAALGAYVVAQLVLFRLYLPHRYTYPLVAFFPIAIGVALLPTWTALWGRRRWTVAVGAAVLGAPILVAAAAVHLFPLGPMQPLRGIDAGRAVAIAALTAALAAAAMLGLLRFGGARRPALAALLCGLTLLGVLVVVPDHSAAGWTCAEGPTVRYLAGLPKDAVIAGDPLDLNCLPATTRRAVVISTQLAPSYETSYFLEGRARMFAALAATYGTSTRAIADLGRRYGATVLWVRRDAIQAAVDGHGRWTTRAEPFRSFVARTLAADAGTPPAALHLPAACRRFQQGANAVYDIACLAGR